MTLDELDSFINIFDLKPILDSFNKIDSNLLIVTPTYEYHGKVYQGKPITIHRYEIKTGLTKLYRAIYKLVDKVLYILKSTPDADSIVNNRSNAYVFNNQYSNMMFKGFYDTTNKSGTLSCQSDLYTDELYRLLTKNSCL